MIRIASTTFCLLLFTLSNSFCQSNILKQYIVDINVDDSYLETTETRLIQVNEKEGNWIGNIHITHSPKSKFKIHFAELLDANMNKIRSIKSKDIHTESAGSDISMFDDHLTEVFSVIHNKYPYFIRYSYTVKSNEFFYIDGWSPINYYKTPTEYAKLTITHPDSYKIKVKTTGIFEYQTDTIEGNVVEVWQKSNSKAPKHERYAPDQDELLDEVFIVPQNFTYGQQGSQQNWEEFGSWTWDLIKDKPILHQAYAERIINKFQDITDTLELIQNLYNFLQDETRYISVTEGIGGIEPYSANYVAANSYGDCKALSIYMMALLRLYHIDSYYTKVYASNNPIPIDTGFAAQQFNHIILCVPLPHDTIWLENTSKVAPANYMGTFTQNRNVLIVKPSGSQLIKTPKLTNNKWTSEFDFTLNENGLSGSIHVALMNAPSENVRYVHKHYSYADQKKYFSRLAESNKTTLENFSVEIEDRNLPTVKFYLNVNANQLIRRVANMRLVYMPPAQTPDPDAFKNRERTIRFNYSEEYEDSFRWPISDAQIPQDTTITSKYGHYTCQFEQCEGSITAVRNFKLNDGEYPVEESSDIYTFLKSIKTYESNSPIIIKP